MAASDKRLLQALWVTVLLQLAGRLVDLRWHLTHHEFEATRQQLEAHWLVWLAVLATIGVAVLAIAGSSRADLGGYRVVLVAGLVYAAVAVWHFIEHAHHHDPEVAHVLLALSQVAMLGGAVVATVRSRRRNP
ncbi:MAG: hypothetical protein ACJ76S_11965 [Solirubrobacteraceae bacterium]|jgi:hypothetical protein